ncbi:MAG: hypothetical protein HYU41_03100 [Candidatus Rokubacteria bacterium]|nr:hypothetical protein [Candidatus Rokubacteria bacterium]
MAKPRLWSAALTSISLAFAGLAYGESLRPIELPVAVAVEVALPGLEQAIATDPSIVRADADVARGVLRLTGLLLRQQTVVYAWAGGEVIVFMAKVVTPPEDPDSTRRRERAVAQANGSLYRLTVGTGFRETVEGRRRLPFAFGAAASRPFGANRLMVNGTTRPFGEDREDQQPTGSAVVRWRAQHYEAAAGDQTVDFGPQLLTSLPLRGVVADTSAGPVNVKVFGGTRATPELRLTPCDDDSEGLPAWFGGVKTQVAVNTALRLGATVAMAEQTPLGSLSAEWRRGNWSATAETAATPQRLGTTLRMRRETDTLTFEQRFSHRTAGVSPLLAGVDGFASETAVAYRLTRQLSVSGGTALQPPSASDGWRGGWNLGTDWSPREWLQVGARLDRSFDGTLTTTSGTATARSDVLGSATMTVTRSLHDTPAGEASQWFQSLRAERAVDLGPVKRVLIEESLTQSPIAGSVNLSVGAEMELGWVKASVAPGLIIPTVTDPNGIAQSLRLRVTASPSAAFQVQTELRQTFGARPDTTVHVGLGVGFGSASPLGSPMSWFARTTVDGIVFVDANGNGRWDKGERGLADVPVQIEGGATVTTDAEGRYRFPRLREGTYRIGLDRANLPANLRLASASPVTVRLPDGSSKVQFAFVGSGAIHGMLFNDVRFSGRFSGSEPGVTADVLVEGPGVRRTLAVNGAFSLSGLAPGRYRVSVDTLSLPPAFVIDRPEIDVELGAGDAATAQFPVVALRAISIVACFARGKDECSGDAPVAGLRVANGSTVATTDAKGRALMRQLPAGRTTLTIDPASVPAGWTAPRSVVVDLPVDPATQSVTVRLTRASR